MRRVPGSHPRALPRATTTGAIAVANLDHQIAQRRDEAGVEELLLARDALADVAAAERAGADVDEIGALRASILVATGRAGEVVPQLEVSVARHSGFASRSALAGAYAAVGRFADADRMYVTALADLDTTSPFPFAWVYSGDGADRARRRIE